MTYLLKIKYLRQFIRNKLLLVNYIENNPPSILQKKDGKENKKCN